MSGVHVSLVERAAKLAAAAAALKQMSRGGSAPFALAFLTDARRIADPIAVAEALPEGSALVYRDYEAAARRATASRLSSVARRRGLFFLVAGDASLAKEVGADGVHLPSRALARRLSFDGLVTASCHSSEEIAAARRIGADAIFLSPVFATKSHPGAPALGPGAFRKLAAEAAMPVFALGGVDAENAGLLPGENVAGFGAIDAFAPR